MDWWNRFADLALNEGYVLALAGTCLLQYFAYLHLRYHAWHKASLLNDEVILLKSELSDVQRDRAFVRLENQLVREFVTQPDIERSLSRLLKEFVPDSRYGFAVYLELHNEEFVVRQSRGNVLEVNTVVPITTELKKQLAKEKLVTWSSHELLTSSIALAIHKDDFRNVEQLHLVPILDNDFVFGILVTTQLYPVGMPEEWQQELVRRIAVCIAPPLRNAMQQQAQQSKLQLTTEMLSLRTLCDLDHGTPLAMFKRYLQKLMTMVNADTASLYLSTNDDTMKKRALVRCGQHKVAGVDRKCEEFEHRLATYGFQQKAAAHLSQFDLEDLGIDSLIGRALVVPMVQTGRNIGIICLSRRGQQPFPQAQVQLGSWAGEYLADRFMKAMDHAAVEREAKQDGLTQLANRRTFDQLVSAEIRSANEEQRDCSLCMFDIDHFKKINDTYGHQAGDEVLRVVANTVMEEISEVRVADRPVAARYGGEELVVLLPGIGNHGAVRISESIRRAIGRQLIQYNEHVINVTVSAGIGSFPIHARTVKSLIHAADAALYRAKRDGRNRVCVAQAQPEAHVVAGQI